MRLAYKAVALVAALTVINCSTSVAQQTTPVEQELLLGAQVHDIIRAWSAVETEYAPTATLEAFEIRYLRSEDSITVSFFKPNTVVRTPEFSIIRQDSQYFQVVLQGTSITVFPNGERN